jgi:hypothetical protein
MAVGLAWLLAQKARSPKMLPTMKISVGELTCGIRSIVIQDAIDKGMQVQISHVTQVLAFLRKYGEY